MSFKKLCPLAVLMLGAFSVLCCYFVKDYEVVIVTQFGKPVRTIEQPGLHFKWPWIIEDLNRFDKRIAVFETPSTQLLLGDKRPIIVSCFVAWTIDAPLSFFQSVGDVDNAVKKISDMVTSRLSIILGDYTNEQIINTNAKEIRLTQIETRIKDAANLRAKEKYGVRILNIGIQRLAYPSTVIKAVYDRMKSERIKEAEKIKAEGAEVASRLKSKADKESRGILAKAQKKALILKGEGEKEAMEIYTKAYGQDKEFFNFLKSLETYNDILGKDTTLILSSDSKLFKYLGINQDKKQIKRQTGQQK